MNNTPIALAALLGCCLLASPASASTYTFSAISTPSGSYAFDDTHTLIYSPSPALQLGFLNDIPNQSAATIRDAINTSLGLSLGASVSQCDLPTSACSLGSSGNAGALGDGMTNSFTSAAAYDYLAVHYGGPGGGSDLLFHWSTMISAGSTFEIGGLRYGLSNYRAFVSPIPEPHTYAMTLAGLCLFGVLAQRRRPR